MLVRAGSSLGTCFDTVRCLIFWWRLLRHTLYNGWLRNFVYTQQGRFRGGFRRCMDVGILCVQEKHGGISPCRAFGFEDDSQRDQFTVCLVTGQLSHVSPHSCIIYFTSTCCSVATCVGEEVCSNYEQEHKISTVEDMIQSVLRCQTFTKKKKVPHVGYLPSSGRIEYFIQCVSFIIVLTKVDVTA